MTLTSSYHWESPSNDPNDETFGDVVDSVALDDAPEYDALLVGEPFDAAVIGRRGAAEGPERIREALAGVKTHQFGNGPIETRIGDVGDVGDGGNVVDGDHISDVGDVGDGDDIGGDGDDTGGDGDDTGGDGDDRDADTSANTAAPAAIQAAVSDVAREVHATAALPVFLGGDNSLTFANVAPLLVAGESEATAEPSEKGDAVGVINFDAHLDVREDRNGPTSGTPYRQLFDAGLDAYCCVGARHFETSTAYADVVTEQGGTVITAEAVGDDLDRAIRRVRNVTDGVDHVYLSVDCDVLDAAAAPGVSAPTPGGLTTRELFRLVRRLARSLAADDRLAGIEVVECAPPLDVGGRTVDAAARTVAHALGGALGHGERDALSDEGEGR